MKPKRKEPQTSLSSPDSADDSNKVGGDSKRYIEARINNLLWLRVEDSESGKRVLREITAMILKKKVKQV